MALYVANWQTIDTTTMQFPAEMLVDYVRVYQRKGQTNIGCDPPNYPTANYIQRHLDTYSSAFFLLFFLSYLWRLLTPWLFARTRCEFDEVQLPGAQERTCEFFFSPSFRR